MAATKTRTWDELSKGEQERERRRLAALPETAQAKTKGKGNGFTLKGYVRCELSAADKDGFKSWEAEHSSVEVLDQLIKSVDSGYLLKLGENGNAFQASLCAATTSTDWDGYVLTAHASSASRAAMLLIYKHDVLMQRDWNPWLQEEGEDFFR